MWRKEAIPQDSRIQQLSTHSKEKGILKSVTVIEASLYCQLLGRSLLESPTESIENTFGPKGHGLAGLLNILPDSGEKVVILPWHIRAIIV